MTLNLKNWIDNDGDKDCYHLRLRHPETDAKRVVFLDLSESSGVCSLVTDDRGDPLALEMAIRDLAGVEELEHKAKRYDLIADAFNGDGTPNMEYIRRVLKGDHDQA